MTWEIDKRKVWGILIELKKRIKTLELIIAESNPHSGSERSGEPLHGENPPDTLINRGSGGYPGDTVTP